VLDEELLNVVVSHCVKEFGFLNLRLSRITKGEWAQIRVFSFPPCGTKGLYAQLKYVSH
jgi:hypothetical protein